MKTLIGVAAAALIAFAAAAQESRPPNILVIWGDDIGYWNLSYNNRGMMGYRTPNIDRIANEGVTFTDYYGEQSCTAAAPPSSPASRASAPACSRSACRARRWACRPRTRLSPRC
jgi:hypothetical protein